MDLFSILLNKIAAPSSGESQSIVTVLDMSSLQNTLEEYVDLRSATGAYTVGVQIAPYICCDFKKLHTVNVPYATEVGIEAFANCESLKNVTLYKTGESAISSIVISERAFSHCGINTVTLSRDNGQQCIVREEAFAGCPLKDIYISGVFQIYNRAFADNTSSEILTLTKMTKNATLYDGAFQNCTSLKVFRFTQYSQLTNNLFDGCENLKAICLTNSTATTFDMYCVYNNDTFVMPDGCYLYVPSKILSSAKSALPKYTDRIRDLESYTVDGTVTGELDPDKI